MGLPSLFTTNSVEVASAEATGEGPVKPSSSLVICCDLFPHGEGLRVRYQMGSRWHAALCDGSTLFDSKPSTRSNITRLRRRRIPLKTKSLTLSLAPGSTSLVSVGNLRSACRCGCKGGSAGQEHAIPWISGQNAPQWEYHRRRTLHHRHLSRACAPSRHCHFDVECLPGHYIICGGTWLCLPPDRGLTG